MLPSNLNKFKEYLHSTAILDEEHLAELFLMLQDNFTRSKYIMTIETLNQISKTGKPRVDVHTFMNTTARYMERRIVITSYYANTDQKKLIDHLHMKLAEKLDTQPIMLYAQEYLPTVEDNSHETMIGEN